MVFVATLSVTAQETLIRLDNERLEIRNNSPRLSRFHKELARLLVPENAAYGVTVVPSNSKESALTYDSVAHAIVLREAEACIWGALRNEPYEAPAIKTYTIPYDYNKAKAMGKVLDEMLEASEVKEDNTLDGIRWEFFSDKLRAYTKNHNGDIARYTEMLFGAVRKGDVDTINDILDGALQYFGM